MDWTHLAVNHFLKFMLVFLRVASVLALVPLFGLRQIPAPAKLGFAYFMTLILYPVVPVPDKIPQELGPYAFLVAQQVFIGIILGYASFLVFTAIQLAGQIVDLQMGFGIANIIDPLANIQQTLIGQYQFLVALMFFLVLNGHHWLLVALSKSFQLAPIGSFHYTGPLFEALSGMLAQTFVIAYQIAFPTIAALFLTDLSLGFIARMVPQMNVFIVGFPLKIGIGFLGIVITLNLFTQMYPDLFSDMHNDLLHLLRTMGK